MVVFRSEFTDSKAMAAVHAAVRLVSPIETTIHAGQVILLAPGKSGTLNAFFNDDIIRFIESNKKKLDNFYDSFGDEFENTKAVPVLVRTGAHFYGPGDRQFITVVYSGSGRGVFNFDANNTTHPLQKLYVTTPDTAKQIYVTNIEGQSDKNLFLGYALFDIPACTSEIQTDILICREDGPSGTSTASTGGGPTASTSSGAVSLTTAGTTPTPTPLASLTTEEKKIIAKEFLKIANKYRRDNGNINDKDRKQKILDGFSTTVDNDFYDELYDEFDFTLDDGYTTLESVSPLRFKETSISAYKAKIEELRKLKKADINPRLKTLVPENSKNEAELKYLLNGANDNKQRIAIKKKFIAYKELGLNPDCVPSDEDFWNDNITKTKRNTIIKSKIDTCDEMRPETAVGK